MKNRFQDSAICIRLPLSQRHMLEQLALQNNMHLSQFLRNFIPQIIAFAQQSGVIGK